MPLRIQSQQRLPLMVAALRLAAQVAASPALDAGPAVVQAPDQMLKHDALAGIHLTVAG